MKQKLIVTGRLPGYNELKAKNWQASYRIKHDAMERVLLYAKAAQLKPLQKRACVRIACYEPNLKRDEDNVLFGASKIVLDSLQLCGVLKNDNRRWVTLELPPVELDREKPRVEIEMEEL